MGTTDDDRLAVPKVSSGIPVLDELLDGVLVGDNVVLLVDDELSTTRFVEPFLASSPAQPLVVVRCRDGALPTATFPQRSGPIRTLDAHTFSDVNALIDALGDAMDDAGEHAVWIIDDLSNLQRRLGPDATLEVFARTCPRLYRQRSVAYWTLRRDQHDRAFTTSLRAITQVVIDVAADDEGARLEVLEADGRPTEVIGRTVEVMLDPEVTERAPITAGRERLGDLLRNLRSDRGVGQAELARRVGISPSALSQAERGVRGLAGETLLRIWDALDVEVGGTRHHDRGYRVHRRGSQTVTTPSPGLTAWQVHDEPGVLTTWRVTAQPGSNGQGSPFPSKRPEAVVLLAGVLELRLGERLETLQEGDAVVATEATINAWRVPFDAPVELLWSLVG